jgi:hypothetical protein
VTNVIDPATETERERTATSDAHGAAAPWTLAALATKLRNGRDALLTMSITSVIMGVALYPMMMNRVALYDDEGYFLVSTRELLDGRSLYSEVSSAYGPFYHFFTTTVYRIVGQEPTLTNSRLLVLGYTLLTAAMFAGAVWRLTRSLPFTVLTQAATFAVLMRKAGAQPLHPGSMVVLGLAGLTLLAVAYALRPRTWMMAAAGGVVGALVLTKINVGVAAAVALAVALVVGNDRFASGLRALVAAGALALPFVMTAQRQTDLGIVGLTLGLGVALLVVLTTLGVDRVSLPPRDLLAGFLGAVGVLAASCLWLVGTGTPLGRLPKAMITGPLRQVDVLFGSPAYRLDWISIGLTIAAGVAAVARGRDRSFASASWLAPLLLTLAAMWAFGQGLPEPLNGELFARWLPIIAVLPALAFVAVAPPHVRLALRILTPLAVLQVLHAYPVAGAQTAWATVGIFVPCAAAAAFGAQRFGVWRALGTARQLVAAGALGLVVITIAAGWPVKVWRDYGDLAPLDLPGAALVRVDPGQARTYRTLTAAIKKNCDTFYAAPALNSFYIYTGIDPPTGRIRNWPGSLDRNEQTELAHSLADASKAGKRVCIVRVLSRQKEWLASSYGSGPLGAEVARYRRPVLRLGDYTLSARGGPPAATAGAPAASGNAGTASATPADPGP